MQYWLFQCNPQVLKLKEALRAGVVTQFAVKQHKDKIHPNDKIILWQTGKQAGVYALATVLSEVVEASFPEAMMSFYHQLPNVETKVRLRIDYNLWNKPVTKELIPNSRSFDRFYAGLPGTNYAATHAQYKEIVHLIEQHDILNEPVEEYVLQKSAHYPLNLILHGPPGTGKTYNTINYALAIIENRSLEELRLEDRVALRQRFEEYKAKERIHFVTFHQSTSYEDFVEGIKPQVEKEQVVYRVEDGIFKQICQKARKNLAGEPLVRAEKHVLIIDEINRGNIAAIFGELITLIEPDKREGQSETQHTLLPYSKSYFSVPPNLYLICTMNTIDRSIDTMDMALRRRFTFVEIRPNPLILRQQGYRNIEVGVNLEEVLRQINKRISVLLDQAHTIGHSFLMNVHTLDDLREAFATKIIPLLQEYFYGDLAKIGLILGSDFIVETAEQQGETFATFDYDYIQELSEKKIYQLRPIEELKEDAFIRIYDKRYER